MRQVIESPNFHIRDGRADVPEYAKSVDVVLAPRSIGWARRPPHGHTMGKTYKIKSKVGSVKMKLKTAKLRI